jgi:hypothetical protein
MFMNKLIEMRRVAFMSNFKLIPLFFICLALPSASLKASWGAEYVLNGGTAILMDAQIANSVNKSAENLVAYSNNVAKAAGYTGSFFQDEEASSKVFIPIGLRGELRFIKNNQWGFGVGGGYQFGAKWQRIVKSAQFTDTLTLTYNSSRWDASGTIYFRRDLAKTGTAGGFLNIGVGAGYYQGSIGYQLQDSGNFLTGNYTDKFQAKALGYHGIIEIQEASRPHRLSLGFVFTYVPMKNWQSSSAYLVNSEGKPLETNGMQVGIYVGYAFAASERKPAQGAKPAPSESIEPK